METGITFQAGTLQLEGLYQRQSNERGVIVTHPHSLYGGDMYNTVVGSVIQTYAEKGFTTLRFNFRGVGGSQGGYDNGEGEQQDVLGALNFLLTCGLTNLHLVGYSFGSWVNLRIDDYPDEVSDMVAISPPVALLSHRDVTQRPLLQYVISGTKDDFGPEKLVRSSVQSWNPKAQLEFIDNCDHFFSGHHRELEDLLSDYLTSHC